MVIAKTHSGIRRAPPAIASPTNIKHNPKSFREHSRECTQVDYVSEHSEVKKASDKSRKDNVCTFPVSVVQTEREYSFTI